MLVCLVVGLLVAVAARRRTRDWQKLDGWGGNENVTIINFKCREGGRMMSQLVRRGEGVRGDDVAVN